MHAPIQFHTPWRKSTFSAADADCVEVAFGTWHKSSHSAEDANCVEVAFANQVVGIRDSKNQPGPLLTIPPTTWTHLVTTLP